MNMPILTQFQEHIQTMSSREVAQLCNKEHRNVCRDIENLNLSFEKLGLLKIEQGYFTHPSTGAQQHRQFFLTKEQCVDLVTGYNAELRIKINRRWAELENAQTKLPQSFAEALQLAADQARQLELAAPKVQYFDTVVERATLLNATQVAQKIRMSAMAMNKLLDSLNVYSRGVKRARVFQQWFVDKGLGELKQTELGFSQPMFTTKGEAWVIEKLVSEGVLPNA